MAGERTLNFGDGEINSRWQMEDVGDGGDLVMLRDLDNGGVVLLRWNATASAWEYGGPVDLDGNDLSDAGTTVYDANTDTVGDGTTSANHQSVDTGDLQGSYPSKLRLVRDTEVVATVDPDATTDPVTALLNQSERGDKVVFPPYKTIIDSGPIYPRSDQVWYPNNATIEITGDSGGLVIDGNAYGQGFSYLFGTQIKGSLSIKGQGDNSGQGGYAVHRKDGMADWSVEGRLFVDQWDGTAWKDDAGSSSYQNQFRHLKFANVDAGDDNGVIWADGGGAPERVDYLSAAPTATGSASNSQIIEGTAGPGWVIGEMNLGGAVGRAINQNTGSIHGTHISHINYEARNQQSAATSIVRSASGNPLTVGCITFTAGSADYVYQTFNADNEMFGPVKENEGTINNSPGHVLVQNAIATDATATYAGPSSQVANGNGGRGLACLSDLTLAT